MTLLIRKITRSKWPSGNYLNIDINTIRADAISSCLRTSNDTLSTWAVDSEEKIEEAVLALACGCQKIENMDIICMDWAMVESRGFLIKYSAGKTIVEDLITSHYDIINLNYKTIGEFATFMLWSFNECNHKRVSAASVRAILVKAIAEGRLDKSKLNEKIRIELN